MIFGMGRIRHLGLPNRAHKVERMRDSEQPTSFGSAPGAAAQARVDPEPSVRDAEAAAFFDLDNTMVRGTSMIQLAKGLYARKYFRIRVIARAIWLEMSFRAKGEHGVDINEVQRGFLSVIEGKSSARMAQDTLEIYEKSIAPKIWPQTHALARDHLAAGKEVWLVTAAPVEVARVTAEALGMSGGLGTEGETRDGIFTGRLKGPLLHGPSKAAAVHTLAAERGFDLSECHAYSDSSNDLPMLELVGSPHVVNPDPRLRAIARERAWPIHDFRRAHRRRTLLASGLIGGAVGAATTAVIKRARQRRPDMSWSGEMV